MLSGHVMLASDNLWRTVPGDVTNDGLVDAIDIQVIMANIGRVGEHLTTYDGDVNGDGRVDEIDVMIALDHLGETIFTYFDGEGGAASSVGCCVDCPDNLGGWITCCPESNPDGPFGTPPGGCPEPGGPEGCVLTDPNCDDGGGGGGGGGGGSQSYEPYGPCHPGRWCGNFTGKCHNSPGWTAG